MKRARIILVGGLTYFAASVLVSLVLAVPEEVFLEETYQASRSFLRTGGGQQDAAGTLLFPAWLLHKLVYGFAVAVLYRWAFPSMPGAGWKRGALFGLGTWPLIAATYLGQWSILALPGTLWIWWSTFYLVSAVVSAAAMGAAVVRYAGAGGTPPPDLPAPARY